MTPEVISSYDNLYFVAIKIFWAILLSAAIGIEREFRHKDAGLRPHILVGVGSTLIVLTSMYLFDIYKHETSIDPTRLITGIVTGIGFVCAGAIMKAGDNIKGITTASTLWIVSGVGIAVGAGQYHAAILVTIMVLLVLIFVRSIEKIIWEKFGDKT